VRMTKKAGISVRAAFMLGNQGETEETLKATIDYAIQLEPDLVIFNVTTPFPGTQLFEWADSSGCLLTKNWREYDLSKPLIRQPGLHESVVQKYYRLSYRRFYLRIGYVVRRLLRIRGWDDVRMNLQGIKAMMALR
jgi:anaerobic magnesium-protoporphyrin IX monomethyl ester cyclase